MRPEINKTVFTCPAFFGGDNWWPYSFDPQTGYAYVPTMHTCMKIGGLPPQAFQAGAQYINEQFTVEHVPGEADWGEMQAIDVATGKHVWGMHTVQPWNDGSMSTDGGLVFSGTPDRHFYAFDARTGKVLWRFDMRSGTIGVPMTYRVDGRQYVAIQSGWGGVSPFYGGKHMGAALPRHSARRTAVCLRASGNESGAMRRAYLTAFATAALITLGVASAGTHLSFTAQQADGGRLAYIEQLRRMSWRRTRRSVWSGAGG